MIYVLSGGTKLFAAIGVTYPAGSTLTCTNGTKTLKAKTTTGQWVFAIPEAGTWTVTATQGSNSKSQSVSITTEGQFEEVALRYELVLFDSSVTSGFTLLNQLSGYGSASISGGKMTLAGTYVSSAEDKASSLYYKSAKVSTSGYTKARVTVDSAFDSVIDAAFDTSKSKAKLVLQSTAKADITASNAAEVSITGKGTYTVALPSGSYYVGLMVNARAKLIVSKIWFE